MRIEYILLSILLIFIGVFASSGAMNLPEDTPTQEVRYLVETGSSPFIWEEMDKLPFDNLGQMCWTEEEGWSCDPRLQTLEPVYDENGMFIYNRYFPEREGRVSSRFFDWDARLRGVVFRNVFACWVWVFSTEYGKDNNPHPVEFYWTTCPE